MREITPKIPPVYLALVGFHVFALQPTGRRRKEDFFLRWTLWRMTQNKDQAPLIAPAPAGGAPKQQHIQQPKNAANGQQVAVQNDKPSTSKAVPNGTQSVSAHRFHPSSVMFARLVLSSLCSFSLQMEFHHETFKMTFLSFLCRKRRQPPPRPSTATRSTLRIPCRKMSCPTGRFHEFSAWFG